MTNYATEPLETLNIDLNAAVFGVNSLSGYATKEELDTKIGSIDTILDSINGQIV